MTRYLGREVRRRGEADAAATPPCPVSLSGAGGRMFSQSEQLLMGRPSVSGQPKPQPIGSTSPWFKEVEKYFKFVAGI